MTDRPTAAPARFPYLDHRTLAEVMADETRRAGSGRESERMGPHDPRAPIGTAWRPRATPKGSVESAPAANFRGAA